MIDQLVETEIDAFLSQVLEEMPVSILDVDGLYEFIVKRDGCCKFSRAEIEAWLNGLDCFE